MLIGAYSQIRSTAVNDGSDPPVFRSWLVEDKKYLETLGVPVDDMQRAELASLKIPGTLTVLLVDHGGVVKNVWVGQLASRSDENGWIVEINRTLTRVESAKRATYSSAVQLQF
jgi:hypothetical protein